MHIQFCGAARTVTGSSHLLVLDDGFKVLLDCGLFQGHQSYIDEWNQKFWFSPSDIDVLILSHAHIDHSGRIPKLVKEGFSGKIYCTSATQDLCNVMLLDSAHIQVSDSEFHNKKRKLNHLPPIDPLYTPDDVPGALKLFEAEDYEQWFDVHPGVSVMFRDNGHILGSGSVNMIVKNKDRTTRIGFSGDIGRPNRPVLKDPIPMEPCDYLISESTYGGRIHEKFPDDLVTFQKIIDETCFERKGKVIIPAFSIGRTQELVYMLNKMDDRQVLQNLPVYVDSPLSTNATEIYRRHPECFDEEMKNYLQSEPNPFGFNNLKYITEVEDSKALNSKTDPCIIISASGMAEAGRIVHHLANNIEDEKNTVLMVGYCGDGTLGRRIRDGQNPVRILGVEHPVRAHVAIMDSFSAHGDQKEMLDFLKPLATNALHKTFLVHGDYDEGQLPFQKCLSENGWNAIEIPTPGQSVEII